jgi:hypothetical protein
MTQQCEKQTSKLTGMETRQQSRAFRKAMSNGLKDAYKPVTSRPVPDEFMELLSQADSKRA